MSSLRRINASRANGARSRGPVTPEGKQRSAVNAVRHGLLARSVVLEHESVDAFQRHLDDFIGIHKPANSVQLGYVETMAVSDWRTRRCWAMEAALVNRAVADNPGGGPLMAMANAYAALGGSLEVIRRYETSNQRIYQRALNNLIRERKSPPPPDLPDFPNEPNPEIEHSEEPETTPPPAAPEPQEPPVRDKVQPRIAEIFGSFPPLEILGT